MDRAAFWTIIDDTRAATQNDDMLAVAFYSYGERTGGETMPCPQVPYPDLGDDWDFEDEEEVKRRYPRLAARYCE
jgi:hypothetical protein